MKPCRCSKKRNVAHWSVRKLQSYGKSIVRSERYTSPSGARRRHSLHLLPHEKVLLCSRKLLTINTSANTSCSTHSRLSQRKNLPSAAPRQSCQILAIPQG